MENAGADAFKRAMRLLPASVTVVATGTAPHRAGLTATAVCSLSAEPPQILACLNAGSATARRIREAGAFSVNILDASHHLLASHFAGAGGTSGEQRFVHGTWDEGPGGMPILRDAVVSLECRLAETVPSATHLILIGRVLDVRCAEAGASLIYRDGRFGTWMAL